MPLQCHQIGLQADDLLELSVPSIGAMPLQYELEDDGTLIYTAFSPLNRGNASAMDTLQCLNILKVVFQSPQSGQCLCNRNYAILALLYYALSVPSIGAMPLQYSFQ